MYSDFFIIKMDRRSSVRKLRSSLQKGQNFHSPPTTPKPKKKMRLSAANIQTSKQSNDISIAAISNDSDGELSEIGVESMGSVDFSQNENSNDTGVESMGSVDLLQSEKTNENCAESLAPVDVPPIAEKNTASKKRKQHNALQHNGYTWHVSSTYKNGLTIYYDCAQ